MENYPQPTSTNQNIMKNEYYGNWQNLVDTFSSGQCSGRWTMKVSSSVGSECE